ncbi:hypothetical protein HY385_02330 [Candidatus Daviesbacteria bacterium]|nr:hypothetical protein [Candidatus Daviesbacteria bacterium]
MARAEEVAELLLTPLGDTGRSCFEFFKDQPFLWTSGAKSPVYTDNRLFQSFPIPRARLTQLMAEEITEQNLRPFGLAAVFSSAIFHADGLARLLNLPMITVRTEPKTHGSGKVIDGWLEPGQNYLVVEDQFSTGGSATDAINNVRAKGGKVTDVLSISTYNWPEAYNGFQKIGVRPISVTNFSIIFRTAIRLGLLDKQKEVMIEDWQQDHSGWAKKHGFE